MAGVGRSSIHVLRRLASRAVNAKPIVVVVSAHFRQMRIFSFYKNFTPVETVLSARPDPTGGTDLCSDERP